MHATRHARLFPAPSDLRVNLMPFIMGDKNSLPDYLQPYWPLVEACQLGDEEKRKVGYLTITESQVLPGETQRTPGLHIDAPGAVSGIKTKSVHVKKVDERTYVESTHHLYSHGRDMEIDVMRHDHDYTLQIKGGIYICSTQAGSCRVWDCLLQSNPDVIGPLGDAEHFREQLDKVLESGRGPSGAAS